MILEQQKSVKQSFILSTLKTLELSLLRVRILWVFSSFVFLFLLIGCSGLIKGKLFKERATEVPPPSDQHIEKTFFVDSQGKSKTFLCAWAPEIGRGAWGEQSLLFFDEGQHCNLEFQITENYLIGKLINPSFPNDRNRWREALRIPIVKHYYYEKNKDNYGRETNEWIENSLRSDWSARPMMTLNLSGIQIWSQSPEVSYTVSNVEDIEWDKESNFLGFSINMSAPQMGNDLQQKVRVNFLKFEHDKTFKKVPYHQQNAKYFNLLYVMGSRIDGVEPELYAGHWDTRIKRKLYLNGIPKEFEDVVKQIVEHWNETFEKIGVVPRGFKLFEPVVANLKHPFDLRYPALTWIADERISMYSPLGIGMSVGDIQNGNLLWGSVVLWGGELTSFVNSYLSTQVSASASAPDGSKKENMNEIVKVLDPGIFTFPDHIKTSSFAQNLEYLSKQGLIEELKKVGVVSEGASEIANKIINQNRMEAASFQKQWFEKDFFELIGINFSQWSYNNKNGNNKSKFEDNKLKGIQSLSAHRNSTSEYLIDQMKSQMSTMFVEKDLNLHMMSQNLSKREMQERSNHEILETIVGNVVLHELGHFFGLGHQFKENIVPEKGTVPTRYIKELTDKATPQKHFTNMTSVMGYNSGSTEVQLTLNDLHPQIHDELVLRYLYKGEYTLYDRFTDQFRFVPIGANGIIPPVTEIKENMKIKLLPTGYFPACNDTEASFGADPFCNRWDRGSSAEDLVKNYFLRLTDSLSNRLYSLTGGKGSPEQMENHLWEIALDTFSRVRLFYDEMRKRLITDRQLLPLWNQLRMDTDSLFDFSKTCSENDLNSINQIDNPLLKRIFLHKDIFDLCRANKLALDQFKYFLNLPKNDFTQKDLDKRYVPGSIVVGDVSTDFSHIFGYWYQLTNFPIKFSALLNLTTSKPLVTLGGTLMNSIFYDQDNFKFLYRTLYPREYTQLVASGVKNNLSFTSIENGGNTVMGRTVLAMGNMIPYQNYFSNDSKKIPSRYNEMLNQQTVFRVGIVAIIIEAVTPDGASGVKSGYYKKFTGNVFDYMSGRTSPTREIYVLPEGTVLASANRMFLFPLTKMQFTDNLHAFVLAYKVDYDYDVNDRLKEDSIKSSLIELHEQVLSSCINGFNENGLSFYFGDGNKSEDQIKFEGFNIPYGIANETDQEKIKLFYDSINNEFNKFETVTKNRRNGANKLKIRTICDEALRGEGLILSAAALMSGSFIGITHAYFE